MSTVYWQVGGFQPTFELFPNEYDQKRTANEIAGDNSRLRPHNTDEKGPVELVLGIKRSGSSHLLITENQGRTLRGHTRELRRKPMYASDYASLSPIRFRTADDLSKKLSYLKPKSAKGGRPVDNSQANKGFSDGSISDGGRAIFEHCRVFHHILLGDIDFPKFSLGSQPWRQNFRVCAFTFNAFKNDTRMNEERLAVPMVLEWGFAEAGVPDLMFKPDSAVHVNRSRNKFLGLGTQATERGNFDHGTVEDLSDDQIQARLQDLFKPKDGSNCPMILLVFDRRRALNIIRNFKVATDDWQRGIQGLLLNRPFSCPVKGEDSAAPVYADRRRYSDYNERQNRNRSRSHSPNRKHDPRNSHANQSRSSGRQIYAPVYVVDLQELYLKMMQTSVGSDDIPSVAEQILFRPKSRWCAGNEAGVLFDIWRSMIAGPPIDDQRVMREDEALTRRNAATASASAPAPAFDPDDDDWDPNDPPPAAAAVKSSAQGAYVNEDEDPYSDDDYGQSDSD